MAALPSAGINLEAKGFQQYVKQLQEIDKRQRETFDRTFKGTDQSYRQIVAASKQYQRELNNELKAIQRAERERAKLAEAAERAAEREAAARKKNLLGGFAGQAIGGFLTQQTAQQAVELAKQAAQFQSQQAGLANLSRSYGTASNEIIAAMQRASRGVLSSSDIIQAANKALLLNVARTPQEFERVTSAAITLGRAMGLTATESIDQFTTALGRRSLLILDNFGISAKQVNAEMERLAQVQFGKAVSELDDAQKNALFMSAALSVAEKAAGAIGEETGKSVEQFERVNAQLENSKLLLGELIRPGTSGLAGGFGEAVDTLNKGLIIASATIDGIDAALRSLELPNFQTLLGGLSGGGGLAQAGFSIGKALVEGTGPAAEGAGEKAGDAYKEAFEKRFKELSSTIGTTFPEEDAAAIADNTQELQDNTDELKKNIEARQKLARQAENIALQFQRAQEDAARKLQRSQEKLDRDQAKARDKLLKNQQKELDKFEADAVKDRARQQDEAAKKEAEIRQNAAKKQQDDQRKLLLQLKQQEERFLLDRQQSRRRFNLQDRRLRAEGDILGLQELRENFDLEQKESQENFDLQQKQTKDSALEDQRQQAESLQEQLQQLRDGLAEQNAEFEAGINDRRQQLLTSFDEQFADLQESQQEQRDELLRGYQEQLEDLNLNRQRQLEDLGRSFVEQEGITKEGAQRVADELEKAFGVEGTADTIMQGFNERTAGNFQKLFDNLEKELSGFGEGTATPVGTNAPAGTAPTRRGRLSFADGGIVPGPQGAPVPALVHGGEMVLNQGQQQQVMSMLAPVVSSQTLNVNVRHSGGFTATGLGDSGAQLSQSIQMDTVEAVRIALQRVKRRG